MLRNLRSKSEIVSRAFYPRKKEVQDSIKKLLVVLSTLQNHFMSMVFVISFSIDQHQAVLTAQIPPTLSLHLSLSFITPGKPSKLHPVPALSWCKTLPVSRHWHIHYLWVCFCSIVPHVLFVLLGWFLRLEVSGSTTVVLWGAASKICSKQHIVFLYIFHLAFTPFFFFVSIHMVHPYSSIATATTWNVNCRY